ncbi:MAG: hypothetical protein Tsb0020_05150 [Haliangiales bacterium]
MIPRNRPENSASARPRTHAMSAGAYAALVLALLLAATAGCDPRVFDELADDTWVSASEPPSDLSTQAYAVAIVSAGVSQSAGANVIAIARNQDGFASLRYQSNGSLLSDVILLGDVGIEAVAGLPALPVTASDPSSPRVVVALQSGFPTSRAHLLPLDTDTGRALAPIVTLDGAEPISALAFAGGDSGGDSVIVARGDTLLALEDITIASVPDATPLCLLDRGPVASLLVDDLGAADAPQRAIVAALPADADTEGEIWLLPADIVEAAAASAADGETAACLDASRQALATLSAPDDAADFGQTVVSGDFDGDGRRDLAVSAPSRETVYVYLDAIAGGDPIALAAPADALAFGHALAVVNLDGQDGDELIVGAPESTVDGERAAGAAYIYQAAGADFGDPIALADAQPEADQRFGQSVAGVTFGNDDAPMLIVGSSQEVYAYFRTPLSDDVRR